MEQITANFSQKIIIPNASCTYVSQLAYNYYNATKVKVNVDLYSASS